MFKVELPKLEVTISLDSNSPDRSAPLQYESSDIDMMKVVRARVGRMTGMYGHSIGEKTTPLDLKAALSKSSFEFTIVEGEEILKMPRQKLPDGAMR